MPGDARYTLDTATRAGEEGRLAEWVCDFLASPGSDNLPLGIALGFGGRWWLGPVEVDLHELVRMAGPDDDNPDIVVTIDEQDWEQALGVMGDSLEGGWVPPPLLVSDRQGVLHIEDGNHRHEALLRAGATRGWAILCFDTEADRRRWVEARASTVEP